MTTHDMSCADYGLVGRVMAGICYVKPHGFYFGPTQVILTDRRGVDGTPLFLKLSEDFLEENNLGLRFGLGQEDCQKILEHTENCDSEGCQTAKERYRAAGIAMKGEFPQGVVLRCAVECGANLKSSRWANGGSVMYLPDSHGWKASSDFFEPYFRWFDGEYRKDWVWPAEVGWPRLSGYFVQAKIDPKKGQFVFRKGSIIDGKTKTARLPLDLIRKIKVYGVGIETTWWNPEVFHTETLTDPEAQGQTNEQGRVEIHFRDGIEGLVERARTFAARGLGFRLKADRFSDEEHFD